MVNATPWRPRRAAYDGSVPLVIYTVLRLALFGGALGLLYLAGMRGWLLGGVAAVAAFALSYVLLARPRDAAARWVEERSRRRRASSPADDDAAHEDAAVDAAAQTAYRESHGATAGTADRDRDSSAATSGADRDGGRAADGGERDPDAAVHRAAGGGDRSAD